MYVKLVMKIKYGKNVERNKPINLPQPAPLPHRPSLPVNMAGKVLLPRPWEPLSKLSGTMVKDATVECVSRY